MRLVSLVPSISETLIAADANLVGRSRYCIHPADVVSNIPKVGGTKDIDWNKVAPLKPDLIILDKEENTLEMAQSCPFETIALHIQSVDDVASELRRLGERLDNQKLVKIADSWQQTLVDFRASSGHLNRTLSQFPGMIEWWREPQGQTQVEYLIWKDPWMAIGNQTFIYSMLELLMPGKKIAHAEKYPCINIDTLDPKTTTLLFSSEPFPFQRYRDDMLALGFSCGLIDGEKFSWYGLRSLAFLQSQLADR